MIRRPPRSTLFPTRRSSDLRWSQAARVLRTIGDIQLAGEEPQLAILSYSDAVSIYEKRVNDQPMAARLHERSEEHTSELQSRQYLVCRLLLEKKNHKRQQYS